MYKPCLSPEDRPLEQEDADMPEVKDNQTVQEAAVETAAPSAPPRPPARGARTGRPLPQPPPARGRSGCLSLPAYQQPPILTVCPPGQAQLVRTPPLYAYCSRGFNYKTVTVLFKISLTHPIRINLFYIDAGGGKKFPPPQNFSGSGHLVRHVRFCYNACAAPNDTGNKRGCVYGNHPCVSCVRRGRYCLPLYLQVA